MAIDLGSLPDPPAPPVRTLTRRRAALEVAGQSLATMCLAIFYGIGIFTIIVMIAMAATLFGIFFIPIALIAGLQVIIVGAAYGLVAGGINGLALGAYAALILNRRVSRAAFYWHTSVLIATLDLAVAYGSHLLVVRMVDVNAFGVVRAFGIQASVLLGLLVVTVGGAAWTIYRLGEWYRIILFPPHPAQPLIIHVDPNT